MKRKRACANRACATADEGDDDHAERHRGGLDSLASQASDAVRRRNVAPRGPQWTEFENLTTLEAYFSSCEAVQESRADHRCTHANNGLLALRAEGRSMWAMATCNDHARREDAGGIGASVSVSRLERAR